MSKRALLLTKLIFFTLLFAWGDTVCDNATWGFTIERLSIRQDLHLSNIGAPPLHLTQRYYLQAQGGQSYVFFSEDGTTVLKFFKDAPRSWLLWPSYQKKKWQKLKRTLQGYHLAFTRLPQESALLYFHVEPSREPLVVSLVDRLNIVHTVDLSSTYFVLQKRAHSLSISDLKQQLPQVEHLLQKRRAAQIADHDPRLYHNLGIVEHQLVFTDPGRFVEDRDASAKLPEKFIRYLGLQ